MLQFEYDENDQLTKVLDVNGNKVVEYTYDSEGRRVEVTDAQGKRDVVVAPTTGGLESPFLIVKENDVEAAFAYAGDMPLARVDEAGNPVYSNLRLP
jgi:YD repeat-containing protein